MRAVESFVCEGKENACNNYMHLYGVERKGNNVERIQQKNIKNQRIRVLIPISNI